jgi:nucleoside-diphosphate-sugar epimerase
MEVFLTGATGYVEGAIADALLRAGHGVLGNTGDTIADEGAPTDPPAIVAWRPALERRVLTAATRGVRSVVIRPAVVYRHGGGIPATLITLAHQSGAARYSGRGENHCTMVHVEDLAEVYARALAKAPVGSLFNAPGGPAFRSKEIAQAISQAAGLGGRTKSWSLEATPEVLGPLADALALDLQFSGDKAKRVLG